MFQPKTVHFSHKIKFSSFRFPNDPCIGSSNDRNGTCYTENECENKGGANAGACAQVLFNGSCIDTLKNINVITRWKYY